MQQRRDSNDLRSFYNLSSIWHGGLVVAMIRDVEYWHIIRHMYIERGVVQNIDKMNSYRIMTTHYNDVIIGAIASQIASLAIVYSTVYSGWDHRKYKISASLAFVCGIHRDRWIPRRKRPVTRKMFPFDDVIMKCNKAQPVCIIRGMNCTNILYIWWRHNMKQF